MTATTQKLAPATPMPRSDNVDTYEWKSGGLARSSYLLRWRDGEKFEDVLQRTGFNKRASIELGEDFESLALKIYGRREGQENVAPRWFAEVTMADVGYLTFVDDTPDLVDLLTRMAPAIAAVGWLGDRSERFEEEREERRAEARERAMWGGRG